MLEILGVIIGLFSLYLAYLTFLKSHLDTDREKKEYLISRMEWAVKTCEETRMNLVEYSKSHYYLGDKRVEDLMSFLDKIYSEYTLPTNLSNIKNSPSWTMYNDNILKNVEQALTVMYDINTILSQTK